MDSKLLRNVKKAVASCAAAAVIMTGSSFGVSAAQFNYGIYGNSVSNPSTPAVLENTVASGTKTQPVVTLPKASLKSEALVSNATHPLGSQTSKLRIRWNKVTGAKNYQVCIKGGKYTEWKKFKPIPASCTSLLINGLSRNTSYQFKIRAVNGNNYGAFSNVQTLSTSRIDFDAEGWKAMCRIVYHEVGQSPDSCWDEPIVHVADCVINRYEAAKYLNDSLWAPYYRNYNSVQSMIYQSGGFMSDAGLANDGATYSNVTNKVMNAVYGSLYGKLTVGSIKHNRNIFYWQNTSYKPTGSKVAYVYPIPWGGYFSIWSEYWG
ncbi:MAG: fibronectin type III domain-containing protein [Ruminococcus sp.]|nr:fibronectin type III domain-containing protein [Ruminococcus sp.]